MPDTYPVPQEHISNAAAIITLEGVTYSISPMRMGHMCNTQRWMKSQMWQEFIEQSRAVQFDAETRSLAMAKVAAQIMTADDVIASQEAYAHLISQHVQANDQPQTKDSMLAMGPKEYAILRDVFREISIATEGGARRSDPTTGSATESND